MKRVGILYHPMISAARTEAAKLQSFLQAKGVSAWLCSAWEGAKARALLDDTDLLLAVGGDGTILRTAQVAFPTQVPITGINLGTLGFITELTSSEAMEKLPALLAGEGWIDERAMIEASVDREHGAGQAYCALNDVVVARGQLPRMVHVEASIAGELLTTYRADGVIAATATGSTAYSLAAGGPILYPQSSEFLLTSIAPHLGSAYSLVLPATAVVRFRISTVHEAVLSIDGHINVPLSDGAVITAKHSSNAVRFLRIHPASFYGTLEQRLKGKQQR